MENTSMKNVEKDITVLARLSLIDFLHLASSLVFVSYIANNIKAFNDLVDGYIIFFPKILLKFLPNLEYFFQKLIFLTKNLIFLTMYCFL